MSPSPSRQQGRQPLTAEAIARHVVHTHGVANTRRMVAEHDAVEQAYERTRERHALIVRKPVKDD